MNTSWSIGLNISVGFDGSAPVIVQGLQVCMAVSGLPQGIWLTVFDITDILTRRSA